MHPPVPRSHLFVPAYRHDRSWRSRESKWARTLLSVMPC